MVNLPFSPAPHQKLVDHDVALFTKTNSTYYHYKWQQRFGFGQWNWSATLFGPFWFAYRKQPLWALLILAVIVAFDFWHTTNPYYFTLALEPLLISGFIANHLYFLSFNRYLNLPASTSVHLTGSDRKGLIGFVFLFLILITLLPSIVGINLFRTKVIGFELHSILWSLVKADHPTKEIKLLRQDYHQANFKGHYQRGINLNQQTLKLAQLKLGNAHQLTIAVQSELATTTMEAGRYQEALGVSNDLLALYQEKFGPENLFTTFASNNVISNYIYQGRYDLAKSMSYNSLIVWEYYPKDIDHPIILSKKASLYSNMGVIQQAYCHYKDAQNYQQEALQLSSRAEPSYTLASCRYFIRLGDLYKEQLLLDEASNNYKKAQSIVRQLIKKPTPIVAELFTKQGELLYLKRDFKGALKQLDLAENIIQKLSHPNQMTSAAIRYLLGKVRFTQGRLDESEQLLNEALTIIQNQVGKENSHYAKVNSTLADFYLFRNNDKVAQQLLQSSLQTMTSIYGLYNPRLILLLEQLATIADKQDKPHQALDYMRRALTIKQRTPLNQLPKNEMIQLDRDAIVL